MVNDKWKIEFYKTANDKSSVDEFVDKLDVKVQNKIVEVLGLLTEFRIKLGMPHSKKVTGTPLWELRILGSDNIRIFYITQTGKTFIILHAFQKKKQKTDKKEIKIALDRLLDLKSRNQN
ncbi:MAG: hypothetical protein UT57_C0043G0002 [Microgenomates group bacterium GW2011_GWC1_39_7]|nr:MAG: hypothetical protein UT57_C0043G0002 [Microgenomates group bacterium GW2011_GWC1_39_7]